MIPKDQADLLAFVVEAALYGVFSTLFCLTTYLLIARARRKIEGLHRTFLSASILMFLLATTHLSVEGHRLWDAYRDTNEPHRNRVLGDISNPTFIAYTGTYVAIIYLGDLLVAYRAWIVWGRNWLVPIVPAVLASVSAGIGLYTLSVEHNSPTGQTLFVSTKLPHFALANVAIGLASNILGTTLIAYQIWTVIHFSSAERHGPVSSSFRNVFAIVIESAALWAATQTTYIILLVRKENGSRVLAGAGPPMVGIVFSLLILRSALGLAVSDALPSAHSTTGSIARHMQASGTGSSPGAPTSNHPTIIPLELKSSRRSASPAPSNFDDPHSHPIPMKSPKSSGFATHDRTH